jgi:hypothetical protein
MPSTESSTVPHPRGARAVVKLVTYGSFGQLRRFRGLLEWMSVEFEVNSGGSVATGLDGEAFELAPLVTLTRRDFARLFRISVGKSAKAPTPV